MLGGFPGQADIGMLLGSSLDWTPGWLSSGEQTSPLHLELRGVRQFTTVRKCGIVVCRNRSAGRRQGISALRIRRTICEAMYFFKVPKYMSRV